MNFKEICHPMIYTEYFHIVENKKIYPVYLPEEFCELYNKINSISDYENNYKSFTKLSFLGSFLQEKYPNIVDFDLSNEALKSEKPWLYILNTPSEIGTIGYNVCDSLKALVDKDCFDEFREEISKVKQSFRALKNNLEPLNKEDILNRDRLIEGLFAHELSSKNNIPLEFDYKEETEDSLAIKKERRQLKIPYPKSEWKYNNFEIEKQLKFLVSYEGGKFRCISEPFECYVKNKIINFSYVVTFDIQSTNSNMKYMEAKISKRTWVNDNKIKYSKNNRKHSLYIKTSDGTFVNIKIRIVFNKDTKRNEYKFISKSDEIYFKELLSNFSNLKISCSLEDIVDKPISYQSNNGIFFAFPHDNVSLGEPSKKNGVSIIEKRAIINPIEFSLGLKPLAPLFLQDMKLYNLPKLNEGVIFTSNIDTLNIYVFQKNENFFNEITLLLKGNLIDFIKVTKLLKDKAICTIETANGPVHLNLILKDGRPFANPLKKDIDEHALDITETIDEICISKNSSHSDFCLIELPDYSKTKDADSKELIRGMFFKNQLRTQFITPLVSKKENNDNDTELSSDKKDSSPKHRIKSALLDILTKSGLIYNNSINNTITIYSYYNHKIWYTYLDSERKTRRKLLEIPLLAKFKENKIKIIILGEDKQEYELHNICNAILRFACKKISTNSLTDMDSCYNQMTKILSNSAMEKNLVFIPSQYKDNMNVNEIPNLSVAFYTSDTPSYYTENIKTKETTKSKGYFVVNLNGHLRNYLIPQKSSTDKINKNTNNYNSNGTTFFQRKLTSIESCGNIGNDISGELFQCYRLLSVSYDGMLDRDILSHSIYSIKEYIESIPIAVSDIANA